MPPSGEEALASARAAVADLDAYRFSLTITQARVTQIDVTGIWVAPGFYDASVSLPVCPPAVPGAPAPTDCLLLPTYQEVALEGVAYSRAAARSDGGWTRESVLAPYDRGFAKEGISPAQQLISDVELRGDVVVSEATVVGVLAYQIVSHSAQGETTRVRIARQTNQLLSVTLVASGSTEEWAFSSHDEPLAVVRPVADAVANPVEWLERKAVRLVEDDSSKASGQLRPFLASDEPIVAALVGALSGGTTIPSTGVRPQGRVLTIHFTDGTSFALAQAFSDDAGGRIADSWYIQGDSPVVVRAAEITDWWLGIDAYFAPVPAMTWPNSVITGEPARFSGRGWPDEVVILSAVINERMVEFAEARTTNGDWTWEGLVPAAVQPGTVEITVGGKMPGVFVHKPASQEIAVHWPTGFAVGGRQARVIYGTRTSAFPVGAPLWSGKIEHRNAVQELVAIVNDAPDAVAPASEVDRSNALHIGHPDGTETLFHFAGDCGVFTPTSVCSDNRWAITHVDQGGGNIAPERYIDAPALSVWWRQLNVLATLSEPLGVPDTVGLSIPITGEGWATGERVTILIAMEGSELVSTHADLRFGEFALDIQHLAIHPGRLVVTVIGQGANAPSATRSSEYQ
jgi:hypothetical protein